jgi:tetratricopeptide (TPR) repeat protein
VKGPTSWHYHADVIDTFVAVMAQAVGLLFLRVHAYGMAAEQFTLVIRRRPSHTHIRQLLARILEHLGRHAEAARHYQWLRARYADVIGLDLKLGRTLYNAGRYSDASTVYGDAILKDPGNVEAHQGLALAHAELRNPDRQLEELKAIAALKPADVDATLDVAQASEFIGRWDTARQYYARALELRPNDPSTTANLGTVMGELGEAERALALVERALLRNPGDAQLLLARIKLFADLGRPETLALIDEGLRLNPRDLPLLLHRMKVLGEAHDRVGVSATAAQALEHHPSDLRVHCALGFARLFDTQADAALREFQLVLDEAPMDVPALAGKGASLSALEKHDEAATCFELVEQWSPGYCNRYEDLLPYVRRTREVLNSHT